MKFYQDKIVQKIIKLKRKGKSSKLLAKEFGISQTTILRWCAGLSYSNPFHLYRQRILAQIRTKHSNFIQQLQINQNFAKIFVSLLYWCEGSKYPSVNFIAFSNSDPNLVKTFLSLLKIAFNIDALKLRVHLQLHTTHRLDEIKKYWCKLLNVKQTQFIKPTITKPTHIMKRKGYYGTCTLRYSDVNLLIEITGIFETFASKFI